MPKRKRVKDYGNILTPSFVENFVNVWTNNQEEPEDLKMVSILFLAEGESLAQLIICEDEMYNGIYHVKTFRFEDGDNPTIIVGDLDDIHSPKRQDFEGLVNQLPDLVEKYSIIIPEDIDLTKNPLVNISEYTKLIMR